SSARSGASCWSWWGPSCRPPTTTATSRCVRTHSLLY
ncbi:hypothetical protein EVAR_62168_1, partial [Eumeta japonica]